MTNTVLMDKMEDSFVYVCVFKPLFNMYFHEKQVGGNIFIQYEWTVKVTGIFTAPDPTIQRWHALICSAQ